MNPKLLWAGFLLALTPCVQGQIDSNSGTALAGTHNEAVSQSTAVARFKQLGKRSAELQNQVNTLTEAASKGNATASKQADLIDAEADLVAAREEEAKAMSQIVEQLRSPAVERELRELEDAIILTKNIKERKALRARVILLRIQEDQRIAGQVNALVR